METKANGSFLKVKWISSGFEVARTGLKAVQAGSMTHSAGRPWDAGMGGCDVSVVEKLGMFKVKGDIGFPREILRKIEPCACPRCAQRTFKWDS